VSSPADSGRADQHLGDRLAALIDGELSHESRDRALAHLATCPSCKAEADAQREVKSLFTESPAPAPSAAFLARLQGLPAEAPGDSGPPSASDSSSDSAPPAASRGDSTAFPLHLLPGGRGRGSLLGPPALGQERGFRIYESGTARAHRGHRLAFAAAGAVSLAAFAIGGVVGGAGAGAASAGSTSGYGTVAAGNGLGQVGVARATAARTEEEREEQPVVPASQTGGRTVPAGPVGPSGELLAVTGAVPAPPAVAASPTPTLVAPTEDAVADLTPPLAAPSVFGAMSPR
jgi:hypothetical protein